MPPFPSLTKTWHSSPYPAIDPTRPELAVWKDKVVVITGAGGAIGRATALSFAKAGASKIGIIGRREGPLTETKELVQNAVSSDVEVSIATGDISDSQSITTAISNLTTHFNQKIDVLVANAGYLPHFSPITTSDPDEWWTGFTTNARGAFNLARAFLPHASADSVVVDVSSCVVHMPALPRASAYVSSKLAATKVWETVGAENEGVSVIHVHPGVVESDINVKSGIAAFDSADLPGQFIVWTVSPEAKRFRGKFLWSNWDVSELLDRVDELSKFDQLAITMNGWPFGLDEAGYEALKT